MRGLVFIVEEDGKVEVVKLVGVKVFGGGS